MAIVNINTATTEEIAALPRIGPGLAQRIVEDRDVHGPFVNCKDMLRVRGISPSITAALFGRLSFRVVDPSDSRARVAQANKSAGQTAQPIIKKKNLTQSQTNSDKKVSTLERKSDWIDEICSLAEIIQSHSEGTGYKTEVQIKRSDKKKIGKKKSPRIKTSDLVTNRLVTQCAQGLKLDPAHLQAVLKAICESRGLLPEGRAVVTLQGDVLWEELKSRGLRVKKLQKKNKDILYQKPNSKYRKKGSAEYERLTKAMRLHPDAAMLASNWGMFHMAGRFYKVLGYPTVYAFVQSQHSSEINPLRDFLRLMNHSKFSKALAKGQWKKFGRRYFGKNYDCHPKYRKLLKLTSKIS